MRSLIVSSAIVALAIHAASADAQTTVTRSQVERATVNVSEVQSYWTKERMLSAKPYDLLVVGGSAPKSTIAHAPPPGQPGFVLSRAAGGSSIEVTGAAAEKMAEQLGSHPSTAGYDYPPPENTWPIPSSWYGSFGIRNVGKVFFTKGGSPFVCSGAAIANRGVLTAGHCIAENGVFHSNWIFVPAYKNGATPYGVWGEIDAVVFTTWLNNSTLCQDVGAVEVADVGGATLGQTVGYLGFAWNQSRLLAWSDHGYPQASPWTGEIQVETDASYANEDNPSGCSPNTTGIGTRQTGGMSGGPWIMVYRPQTVGANNYVNSVNSYVYTNPSQPNQIYGPYIDQSVKDNIFDWIAAK